MQNSVPSAPKPVNKSKSYLLNETSPNFSTGASTGLFGIEPPEPSRSCSAPPAERLFVTPIDVTEDSAELMREDDPRLDPTYPAFFRSRSRLEPRLPPPFYSPGQSWQQLWPLSSLSMKPNSTQLSTIGFEEVNGEKSMAQSQLSHLQQQQQQQQQSSQQMKPSLVDRIQADFPRTPSPVYAQNLRPTRQSKENLAAGGSFLQSTNDDFLTFSMDRLNLEQSQQQQQQQQPPPSQSSEFLVQQPSISLSNLGKSKRFNPAGLNEDNFGFNLMMGSTGFNLPQSTSFYTSPMLPSQPNKSSSLIEEFRANRLRKLELKDLVGHVIEFSVDQHGSRFIQQKLEVAENVEKDLIFKEIQPEAFRLMTDVFGNYVIQKFFEFGSIEQRIFLSRAINGKVLQLSLQMYGCRVIQKALEHLPKEYQAKIVSELDGHVLRLVKDQNGNHVIQKCIESVSSDISPFVIQSFKGQIFSLATHPYGCRVIQRIFEHGTEGQVRPLIEELLRFTPNLVQDQYGNYVIQHLLEKGPDRDRHEIITKIKGNVLNFSRHKFASNVVEKCVSYGNRDERQSLIEEVLELSPDGGFPLLTMMRDQFANYVVQKMLDVVDGEQRELLLSRMKPHLSTLKKFTYGKHILGKVEKLQGYPLPDFDDDQPKMVVIDSPKGSPKKVPHNFMTRTRSS